MFSLVQIMSGRLSAIGIVAVTVIFVNGVVFKLTNLACADVIHLPYTKPINSITDSKFETEIWSEAQEMSSFYSRYESERTQEQDLDLGINGELKVAVTFTGYKTPYTTTLANGTRVYIYGSANIAYAILLDLQEIFNFNISVTESRGFIAEGRSDTITGAGYQVFSGKVDMSIDISKPTPHRAKHLHFLHGVKQDRVAIMFRQPEVQLYRNTLSRPFRNGLWKYTLGSWLLISAATAIVAWKALSHYDFKEMLLSIFAASLARAGSMDVVLQRGRSNSLRVAILVTYLFGLTMYSIYSAFIVSSLRRAEPPIRKFEHLFEYEYELIAQRSLPDFTNVYVRNPKYGNYLAEMARKNFISIDDSLKRLFAASSKHQERDNSDNTNVAWFALKTDFFYMALQHGYTTREICEISQLKPRVREEHPRLLSMFIGKNNSRLRESFNRRILDILARGLARRHVQQFENKFQPECGDPMRKFNPNSIRFYDVYAAFTLLFGGAVIAICIFMFGEVLAPYLLRITNISKRYRVESHPASNIINVREAEQSTIPRIFLSAADLLDVDDSLSICELDNM